MNITISYFSFTRRAGIPNLLVGLSNALSQLPDVNVSLLTLVYDRDDVLPAIRVHKLKESPRGAHRIFTSRWLRPFADRLYTRAIETLKPDWIVCNYYPLDAYAFRFRERYGYKVGYLYQNVTDPSLYEGEERARREAEKAAMLEQVARADAVFGNSDYTARCAQEATGKPALGLPPAADPRMFKPRPAARAGKPTLLHVGRVVKHKGVDLLLEAFAKLRAKHPEAELRIVGRVEATEYGRRVRARAEDIGNVKILHDVGEEEMVLEYQRAWLFTCPSLFEGFGMPFLEAEACGTPCVGFEVGGVVEAVDHGRSGLLVPTGDMVALAGAIDELLNDEGRRLVMADAAVRKAAEFGWDRSAKKLLKRLKEVN